MWIKEPPKDFKSELSFYSNALFLWKDDNSPIYIMDNHLSAAWCWMQECNPDDNYNFMHIDRHSDLKACGYPENIDFLKSNRNISFEKYEEISYITTNNFPFFQWDNYIRACHYLFPQWFNTNIFYTQDYNNGTASEWGYPAITIQSKDYKDVCQGIEQYIQNSNCGANAYFEKSMQTNKWILNIDIDFFWNNDRKKIFDDNFIRCFARRVNNAMNKVQVLTIALSPDCVGGSTLNTKWDAALNIIQIMKEEMPCLKNFPDMR